MAPILIGSFPAAAALAGAFAGSLAGVGLAWAMTIGTTMRLRKQTKTVRLVNLLMLLLLLFYVFDKKTIVLLQDRFEI
jgi:hypothetical protein